MTGKQLAGAVVMGKRFPPVRAQGYPYAGLVIHTKPANNTASRWAAELLENKFII
jgi:hypothetical protein